MPRMVGVLGAASLGRALWDGFLFKRFLADAAAIGVLAVVAGVMAAALLLGVCYALMLALMHYGLSETASLLAVGAIIAVLILISGALALARIRRLRASLSPLSPLASEIGDLTGAFMDGFRGR